MRKQKVKTKNEPNSVCYTGIGSDNKKPNYTKPEFKKLANSTFKKVCVAFHSSKKCKPCKTAKTLMHNFMKAATPVSNYRLHWVTSPVQRYWHNGLRIKCKRYKMPEKINSY